MKRTPLALLAVTALALGACASTSSTTKYSVTPETQVVMRGAKKKPAQANYRQAPEDSMRTGAGGGAPEK